MGGSLDVLEAATDEVRALAGYVALLCLPDPIQPWAYFALATYLLSFPYAHAAQVSWTSRNAGSVATRTVSASCVLPSPFPDSWTLLGPIDSLKTS